MLLKTNYPNHSIIELLDGIGAGGSFVARLRMSSNDLNVEVRGVGQLEFPLSTVTAERLKTVARRAPFGYRDRTMLDESVRWTWEIPKSRVKVNARGWNKALRERMPEIQDALGFPKTGRLDPVFDKLLVYERGQFFKAHQDSEQKSDGMVASLVVILPSKYSGAAVTVEHHGQKKVLKRQKYQDTDLSLLGFYSDCVHEVSPVKSGYRVALTYQLRLKPSPNVEPLRLEAKAIAPKKLESLSRQLQAHFATPTKTWSGESAEPPDRLVYLLNHEYTRSGLSWTSLKAEDRVRVSALIATAESLDVDYALALADIHEVWAVEESYDEETRDWRRTRGRGWRSGRARHDGDVVEGEPHGELELVELIDDTIELHHWMDGAGRRTEGLSPWVGGAELLIFQPSHEMHPFKSNYEGWQGNYGNTLDRWYHRAALVMWPQERTFVLQGQSSPGWAVEKLYELPSGAEAELTEKVEGLLPGWGFRGGKSSLTEKAFRVAGRLPSSDLACAFLASIEAQCLGGKRVAAAFRALIEAHGRDAGEKLLTQWTRRRSWSWGDFRKHQVGLVEALAESSDAECRALGTWMVEQEIPRIRERMKSTLSQHQAWLGVEGLEEAAKETEYVISAALAVNATELASELMRFLESQGSSCAPIFRALVLEPRAKQSSRLRGLFCDSPVYDLAVAELDKLAAIERDPSDWSVRHERDCECSDCAELTRFLESQNQEMDWPLNKERRRHVHGQIDSHDLPLEHTTLRRGSPYVLQLRKTKKLFTREAAHRRKLTQMVAALRRLSRV